MPTEAVGKGESAMAIKEKDYEILTEGTHRHLSSGEFGRLFAQLQPRFEALANRYVRNQAVAEDIVAESFMALWERRAKIAPDSNLPAYILTIVRNRCLDWLRAQIRHSQIEQRLYGLQQELVEADLLSLEAFDPNEICSKEVETIIRETLERMSPLTRQVFEARRFEEKSYKEIAESCGITVRRVEFELTKALREFRTALRDYLPALLILIEINRLRS